MAPEVGQTLIGGGANTDSKEGAEGAEGEVGSKGVEGTECEEDTGSVANTDSFQQDQKIPQLDGHTEMDELLRASHTQFNGRGGNVQG